MSAAGGDIVFRRLGALSIVTLDRPQALNALTLDMARAIDAHLVAVAADPRCRAVLIEGAGKRAFCAGGDIQRIYHAGRAGETYAHDFFRAEYRLNARIHHFTKPYIALMDGIVMGGGVGLSIHGGLRVATERLMLAMPETGIGLFPDVGGGYVLPRLAGQTGMFMALTGARLGQGDAVALGFADAAVASARLEDLKDALAGDAPADLPAARAIVAGFAEDPGAARLAEARARIDAHFGAESVAAIIAALEADGGEWASRQRDIIGAKSPTSLKITHRQLRAGARLDFDDVMGMEYRMAHGCLAGHDFYEGVRAVIIDKDQTPKWLPARLDEVSEAVVAAHFELEPPGGDLVLPGEGRCAS